MTTRSEFESNPQPQNGIAASGDRKPWPKPHVTDIDVDETGLNSTLSGGDGGTFVS